MERQATLLDMVSRAIDNAIDNMHLRMPGTVVAFYPGTAASPPMVDVQPMTNHMVYNMGKEPTLPEDSLLSEPWPVLQKVPVAWPNFGGFVLSGPLAPMDQVMLEAWDLDPSAYQDQGRSQIPVDPRDVGKLDGGYWVAKPLDIVTPLKSFAAAAAGMVIGGDSAPGQIAFSLTGLKLGGPAAADFVALASKVDAMMTALKAFITAASAYATAIKPVADPSNAGTATFTAACSTAAAAIVPSGSAVIGAT